MALPFSKVTVVTVTLGHKKPVIILTDNNTFLLFLKGPSQLFIEKTFCVASKV
jgi:hypothetical protein